ncbi:MAG: prolyl aminopeptidase [Gammaproteobacteria bacterium]|nr:prolyl aminopeptidase [Gammaproteobacteria bacterium]
MRELFPEIEPYLTHRLKVNHIHELYIEECGNPEGIPILFLHGGPGGGCNGNHRRFFDPKVYRIVLFDQRGSGKSTPHASLEENTTQHLVKDIEQVRKHLEVEKWPVFGGSWGATLALVYAQAYPERVSGLILRGVFLCTPEEFDWFPLYGAQRIYPDYYEQFVKPIPEAEHRDLLTAYYARLCSDDIEVRHTAAKAWSIWEAQAENLILDPSVVDEFGDLEMAASLARIECHYFVHNAFLKPNQIVKAMDKIAQIPGIIVQGRYDMICPIVSAWKIHQRWPKSQLNIVPAAGHNAFEKGIIDGLINATDAMVKFM